MQKREAEFQTRLNKWMQHRGHELKRPAIWVDAKVSRSSSIRFDVVSPKQKANLTAASNGFMYHKFSDAMRWGTPCDAVYTWSTPEYMVSGIVALQFWKPRQKKFYLITIEEWVNEWETSKRESLTESRANEIGIVCYFP